MIYFRVWIAFVGSLLIVFPMIRIVWAFVLWAVTSMVRQAPHLIEGDPRISYRVEAVALAVGLALFLLAAVLR